MDKKEILDKLNAICENTLMQSLGIEFIDVSKKHLTAKMPVDQRTMQPERMLHGGASLALAETVGSALSATHIDLNRYLVRGMSINANHLKPATEGWVYATAKYIHKGINSQVVEIKIVNEKKELISVCRLTNFIIKQSIG